MNGNLSRVSAWGAFGLVLFAAGCHVVTRGPPQPVAPAEGVYRVRLDYSAFASREKLQRRAHEEGYRLAEELGFPHHQLVGEDCYQQRCLYLIKLFRSLDEADAYNGVPGADRGVSIAPEDRPLPPRMLITHAIRDHDLSEADLRKIRLYNRYPVEITRDYYGGYREFEETKEYGRLKVVVHRSVIITNSSGDRRYLRSVIPAGAEAAILQMFEDSDGVLIFDVELLGLLRAPFTMHEKGHLERYFGPVPTGFVDELERYMQEGYFELYTDPESLRRTLLEKGGL